MFRTQINLLQNILEECQYLQKEYQENTFEELKQDQTLVNAINRSLIAIGETCNKVNHDIKVFYPIIPWRELCSFHDRVSGADFEIAWETIKTQVPDMATNIQIVVEDLKKRN